MFFKDDASADDIFNMFFGRASIDSSNMTRTTVTDMASIYVAAILMQKSLKYPHQYLTRNLDVRFYLKDDIHTKLNQ
ncbi:hypothetical protein BV898_17357 [Hypsibius exemplaris]|uniref:Uncharacterized protein n=1 Tax=Hypsibius exemplaris TaxID=2072580 RepID=A0A9X6NFG5_HYPEX|nr:hypothetical protein BV898_17357 [Hypsibius exemplaris]